MATTTVERIGDNVHIVSGDTEFVLYDFRQLMLIDPGLMNFRSGAAMMLNLTRCNNSSIQLISHRIRLTLNTFGMWDNEPVTVEHSVATYIDFPPECVRALVDIVGADSDSHLTDVLLVGSQIIIISNETRVILTHDAKTSCMNYKFTSILNGFSIVINSIYDANDRSLCDIFHICNGYIEIICNASSPEVSRIVRINFSRHDCNTLASIIDHVKSM